MTLLYITLLAGGIGKRMLSDLPKVLHQVKGESMIVRLIKQVSLLHPDKIIIVVGKFFSLIKDEINKCISDTSNIDYVMQDTPLGTGHAVKCTLPLLVNCTNIILNADVPLLQYSTIQQIYSHYLNNHSNFLITAINLDNPTGNGRIILNNNVFEAIVEEKDCNNSQKLLTLVNCGIYIVDSDLLTQFIPMIDNLNAQGEFYLTDLVKVFINYTNQSIDLFVLDQDKEKEIFNVNTKEQLSLINGF